MVPAPERQPGAGTKTPEHQYQFAGLPVPNHATRQTTTSISYPKRIFIIVATLGAMLTVIAVFLTTVSPQNHESAVVQSSSVSSAVPNVPLTHAALNVSTALAQNATTKWVPKKLTPAEQQQANQLVAAAQARYAAQDPASYVKAKAAFDEMLKGSRSTIGASTVARASWFCVPIYRWELEAIAWYIIVTAGATAAVGGFFDATVVGFPVGAVLNAIGILGNTTGGYLLWWTDTYYQDGSYSVCLW